jgi:hypothetical protein
MVVFGEVLCFFFFFFFLLSVLFFVCTNFYPKIGRIFFFLTKNPLKIVFDHCPLVGDHKKLCHAQLRACLKLSILIVRE